jgi:hypothetical protein
MTTNRELFDTVVAEVERDYAHVFEHEEGSMPTEDEEGFVQYEVFDALPLDVPADTFSNFIVRDALMVKANEDDKFAFVLCNKIIHHAKEASETGTFGQAELDALATAIHIQAMWEQAERAVMLANVAMEHAKEQDLKMPSIMEASRKIIMAQTMMGYDLPALRAQMGKELAPMLMQALDTEI